MVLGVAARARRIAAAVVFLASAACGGSTGGGAPQILACGASTPDASVCNAVTDVGSSVQPTCAVGTVPSGTGGEIANGTYALTSQTYYGTAACPTVPLSATIQLSSGCGEEAVHARSADGGALSATSSFTLEAQGSQLTITPTCSSIAGTGDAPTKTYTATTSTLTIFTNNAALGNSNPDRVEVFARQ
jgi:hypothetical protein